MIYVFFHQLRTEGAFLVSAELENGNLESLIVEADKGGEIKIRNSFVGEKFNCDKDVVLNEDIILIQMEPGEKIELKSI